MPGTTHRKATRPIRSQAEFDRRLDALNEELERMRPHIRRLVAEIFAPIEAKIARLEA